MKVCSVHAPNCCLSRTTHPLVVPEQADYRRREAHARFDVSARLHGRYRPGRIVSIRNDTCRKAEPQLSKVQNGIVSTTSKCTSLVIWIAHHAVMAQLAARPRSIVCRCMTRVDDVSLETRHSPHLTERRWVPHGLRHI
jgi:hypothetical protein